MSSRQTHWLPLLLSLLIAGLIWMLNRAAELPQQRAAFSAQMPDLFAEKARVQRFDAQGDLVSTLMAPEVRHLPQDDTMLFERPTLIQTKPGTPKMTLVGERARTINHAEELWLYGAVEMRRAPDAKHPELVIRTRDMYINTKTEIARSSAPVTAEMGAQRAYSVGFVADNRNETLQLLSQVSMTYVPNKANAGARTRLLP